jgi:hypothetical protein
MRYACQHARVVEPSLNRVSGSLHLIRFLRLTARERSHANVAVLYRQSAVRRLIVLRIGARPEEVDQHSALGERRFALARALRPRGRER